MAFTGYCSTAALAKFLDIGVWQQEVTLIASYATNDLSIDVTSSNGMNFHLVTGLVTLYDDGVVIATTSYTIDLETGNITFSVEPTAGSAITATYYLVEDFSDDDLDYYNMLGAYELEQDTRQKFREVALVDYTTDTNEGFDYVNYEHTQPYLELPFTPILSVSALTIDGTSVTTTKLKLKGNRIFLTNDSEAKYFTGEYNTVVVSFKYGITDTVGDRTEEDLMKLEMAEEANKFASALIISEHPLGRNVLFDNSKVSQMSKGDVRPDLFSENSTKALKDTYNMYVNKLRGLSIKTI